MEIKCGSFKKKVYLMMFGVLWNLQDSENQIQGYKVKNNRKKANK